MGPLVKVEFRQWYERVLLQLLPLPRLELFTDFLRCALHVRNRCEMLEELVVGTELQNCFE